MLIDYVVFGLEVVLIGLIVFGGVLCAHKEAIREGDPDDAEISLLTDRSCSPNDRV